jgi:serine transporter
MGLTTEDFYWILMLFGTAVGAGILFLPVQACTSGFWIFAIILLLSLPANYFSHTIVVKFLDSTVDPENYIQVIAQYLGKKFSAFFGVFYFLMLYITLVAYSITLNSDLGAYLQNIGIVGTDLSGSVFFPVFIIGILIYIVASREKIIVRISGVICIILMILLLTVSVFMIHLWHFDYVNFSMAPPRESWSNFLTTFPILLLSIVFFPAVSPMMVHYKRKYGKDAARRTGRIVLMTVILLFLFIGIFTVSSLFSLSTADALYAAKNNLSILTALSLRVENSPIVKNIGPLIEITALVTSFLGLALAAREALIELVMEFIYLFKTEERSPGKNESSRLLHILVFLFFVGSLWGITIKDYSVIDILGAFLAPLYSLFLYILPLLLYVKFVSPKHKFTPSGIFVFVSGMVMMCSFFIGKFF